MLFPMPHPFASLTPAQIPCVGLGSMSLLEPALADPSTLKRLPLLVVWMSSKQTMVPFPELMSRPPLVAAQNNINSPNFFSSFKKECIYLIKKKKKSDLVAYSTTVVQPLIGTDFPSYQNPPRDEVRCWVSAGLATFIQSVSQQIFTDQLSCIYILFKFQGI